MSDNRKKGKAGKKNDKTTAPPATAPAPSSGDLMSMMEMRISQMEEETKKRGERERQAARYAKAQLAEFSKQLDGEGDAGKKLALAQSLFYKQCYEQKQQNLADAEELQHATERVRSLEVACEKEHIKGERMQNFARSLQEANTAIKAENERIVQDEMKKRDDLFKQFQEAEDRINAKIEEKEKERAELIENYEALRKKSLELCDSFGEQEKKLRAQLREKEVENKILEARLAKESESTKIILSKITENFTADVIAKEQLSVAKTKASQMEAALKRSMETLTQYKESMDGAIKRIKALEEENKRVATERDETNIAVIALTEQLKKKTAEHEKDVKIKARLEALCRTYQDRLKKEVKEDDKKDEEVKKDEEKKEEVKEEKKEVNEEEVKKEDDKKDNNKKEEINEDKKE